MEFERLPPRVLERARELVGLSGELLDPEVAVCLALREADRFPVPAPGLHHDLVLGLYGEASLVAALDATGRTWSGLAAGSPVRFRFEAGAPAWASPGAVFRFVGGARDARASDLVLVPPDALSVPAGGPDAVLDPSRLVAGLDSIGLAGTVLSLEPTRSFSRRDGTRGFVTTARIGTDAGIVEVTLWDDSIKGIVAIGTGGRVRFTGLYTKEREGRVEVHTGRNATVEPAPPDPGPPARRAA